MFSRCSPAGVDDLEDHEPLELAHDQLLALQVDPELLLLLGVRVLRVLEELVDDRFPVEALDLVDRHRCRTSPPSRSQLGEIPSSW